MSCEPVTLTGRHVELVPLSPAHAPALAEAVRDGELWRLWYTAVPAPEAMAGRSRAASASRPPAPCSPSRSSTAPGNARRHDHLHEHRCGRTARGDRLHLVRRALPADPLNTEAKRLLLAHAFADLGCLAVEFRTHVMNHASRRAIERLGARLDGILRHHQRMADGSLRDTCVYSITQPEWPTVRTHLAWQLDRPR